MIFLYILNYRKCDSRLAVREFNEKDNYGLSNKAATASDGVRGCRVKETVCMEPDHNYHNKIPMGKSVNTQHDGDSEDYEDMNNNNYYYNNTALQGGDTTYAVPEIATTMRGRDQPRGGERESPLHMYEDPDNPGTTTSPGPRGKFGLY